MPNFTLGLPILLPSIIARVGFGRQLYVVSILNLFFLEGLTSETNTFKFIVNTLNIKLA